MDRAIETANALARCLPEGARCACGNKARRGQVRRCTYGEAKIVECAECGLVIYAVCNQGPDCPHVAALAAAESE